MPRVGRRRPLRAAQFILLRLQITDGRGDVISTVDPQHVMRDATSGWRS